MYWRRITRRHHNFNRRALSAVLPSQRWCTLPRKWKCQSHPTSISEPWLFLAPRLSPGVIARSASEAHDKYKPWSGMGGGQDVAALVSASVHTEASPSPPETPDSLCKHVWLLLHSNKKNTLEMILIRQSLFL